MFWGKRHVVLRKTTRCFGESDTLFWGKRHVVLRNYGWIEEGLSNNPFMDLFFRGLCNHCDTCDSKKAKTPVRCARESSFIIVMTTNGNYENQDLFLLNFIE